MKSIKGSNHGRKLVLGAVALTVNRNNRFLTEVLNELRDKVEPILVAHGFFEGAPFTWISLIILNGLVNASEAVLGPISKVHGDLPVSIEFDCRGVSRSSKEELNRILYPIVLRALYSAGLAYGRDVEFLFRLE